MNDIVAQFIRVKHVDSFQKLRLLLFLHQHPDLSATSQEFATHLYLGNEPLMDEIITDLRRVGLVDCHKGRFKLHLDPDIRSSLQYLTQTFEDPLTRQGILNQVRHTGYFCGYLANAHRLL